MNTNDILRPICKQWGNEKRLLWGYMPDDKLSVDTIRRQCRVKEATISYEDLTPAARSIERAVEDMDAPLRLIMHVNFMVRPQLGKATSKELAISEARYWVELNYALSFIAGRLSNGSALQRIRERELSL